MRGPRLRIVPAELKAANAFVAAHHRHHPPVQGHRWSVAVADEDGTVRGVAIVGRPRSRHQQDGWTVEVLRVCTDGCPNACSALYGSAARAAEAKGYTDIITYLLESEDGGSLRAAGWECEGPAGGGSWDRAGRPRDDKAPTCLKVRWRKRLGRPRAAQLLPSGAIARASEHEQRASGESERRLVNRCSSGAIAAERPLAWRPTASGRHRRLVQRPRRLRAPEGRTAPLGRAAGRTLEA